jgi:hypothetical protein
MQVMMCVLWNITVHVDNDYECVDNFDNKKMRSTYSTLTWRKRAKYKSAWNITKKFSVTLNTVSGINCDMKKTNEVREINFQHQKNTYLILYRLE